ncbi:hypothetical protein GXM_06330 [Nostoc sphaeroides CCNUC1]|uniref:Uncharacterized protein n=1 Tax=Nostoc sphaeroides CCNUC1 TaxID=2653204 RepID=A0A5P8W9G8_9NOSO|nr:hypothetical protein GXM_06330 [Nostoc sphaeroides CCNUC1]
MDNRREFNENLKGQPLPYGTLRERGSQKSKVKSQSENQ